MIYSFLSSIFVIIYYRLGRIYIYPSDSIKVDPREFTNALIYDLG